MKEKAETNACAASTALHLSLREALFGDWRADGQHEEFGEIIYEMGDFYHVARSI